MTSQQKIALAVAIIFIIAVLILGTA